MKLYLVEEIDKDAKKRLEACLEITDQLQEADIILSRNLRLSKEKIDEAEHVKLIAIHGTGVSDCDVAYAKSKGILVCNSPYQNVESVAELNVMLTLMALRKANQSSMDIRSYCGRELSECRVGILGYGHIGRRTREILLGFGVDVMVYNRTTISGISLPLSNVLASSDVIILAMSLEESNYHFVNEEVLHSMKPGAVLVNTARGGLVDESAICEALRSGGLSCYAADVFEEEPLRKDNPLLKENVIAYPHIGANTTDALYKVGKRITDEILDFLDGRTPEYTL